MSSRQSAAVDVLVIGGGPAGCASARLLASWGHRVRLVTRETDRARGLAESLPPSTHKLLAEIGILDVIERASFYRSTGNTVFWASREPRVESFEGLGFQVFRPDLDDALRGAARLAGVEVGIADCGLRIAEIAAIADCPVVLDCSGRAGVLARRCRIGQPEHRTAALVGVWRRDGTWPLTDPTHTVVETFDDGWAWSVPTSADVRHVGLMVERGGAYADILARTVAMRALVDGAEVLHTFACDASRYCSERYATPGVFFVGDAGSFIDPLSSFGVKKALASAFVAAVAAHTCLIDSNRAAAATRFFDAWERRVYDDHLRRSRDFARTAVEAHPHAFWTSRAEVRVAEADAEPDVDVRDAFERIRASEEIDFALADEIRLEEQPVIRGNEIVMEPALASAACATDPVAPGFSPAIRFHDNVDLVALAEIACRHRRVPDMYDAYCRSYPAAPLPNVVSGLSLLVAKGILHART